MPRIFTGRRELEVTVRGEGEPVLLIHGAFFNRSFDAMCAEQALANGFQTITYLRQGYGESSGGPDPYSIGDQAADALAVLRELAGDRAHVLGYSLGAMVSLQLALDAPESVHSLSLLEPGLFMGPSGEALMQEAQLAWEAYEAGDLAGSLDRAVSTIFGPDYRRQLDEALGEGWWGEAIKNADNGGAADFPALAEWSFGPEQARQISQPVLSVRGTDSHPAFHEAAALLKEWFPGAEEYTLAGANHALQILKPGDMAERLATFLSSHPMSRPAAGTVT